MKSKKRVRTTGLPRWSQAALEGWTSGLRTCPNIQQRIGPLLPAGRGYLACAHQYDWSLIYRLAWLLSICWHYCVINDNHWFVLRSKFINLVDKYGLRLRRGQYFSPWSIDVWLHQLSALFLAYIEFLSSELSENSCSFPFWILKAEISPINVPKRICLWKRTTFSSERRLVMEDCINSLQFKH